MNKKTQKGLVAAITATMGAGIVAPAAMAAVDPVAAARQAVERLESAEKYQNAKEIEACRALVKNLTDAKAKQELTVRINRVMLGEYTEATNAVKKAKETRTQKDVTAAYNEAVNLTNDDAVRKNALINALNVVQKELYTKVDKALAKAETELKQEYLNEAQDIIKDMLNPWRKPREAKYTQLQVKLYVNTRTALQTAKNSGLKSDYEIAKALYENVKLVRNNNTVAGWVKNVLTPLFESIVLDSTNPVVTGVEEGKAYKTAVTPTSEEKGLTATLTRNGEAVTYTFGEEITEEGVYVLNVYDANKNVTTLHFTIDMTAPVFKYTGETTINVKYGEVFTLPTVEASELSAVITPVITDENDKVVEKIDTKVPGIYTVTYTAVDAAGNQTELVLTVVVAKTTVKVESVSAVTNTNTFAVTLAEEVKAEDLAGKKLVLTPATGAAVEATFKSLEGKVATFEFAAATAEGEYVVTGADFEIAEATKVVYDKTAPTINSVETKFVDYTTIKVAFNEKVTGVPAVQVNGTNEPVANVALAQDGKSLTITRAAGFSTGQYTVVVNGLKDEATNVMLANSTIRVTKDASVDNSVVFKSTALSKAEASTSSALNFEVYDQYGQIKAPGTITFEASYNGIPVDVQTVAANTVTFNSTMLVKDRVIDVVAYRLDANNNKIQLGKGSFKVDEAVAKATAITTITPGASLADLKAGDTFTLGATIIDQFGNPVTNLGANNKLRWVTSDNTVVAFTADQTATYKDGADNTTLNIGFTAKKEGSATITAYLPDGSAYKSYTVTVGKGSLATINNSQLTNKDITNKAVLTESNIKVNDLDALGALKAGSLGFVNANNAFIPVKADAVTFEVTAPAGYVAGEISVEEVVDANGYLTGLKVTSNRTKLTAAELSGDYSAGVVYTVTAKSNVTGVVDKTFTATSKIDANVATIEAGSISGNQLPAGSSKAISLVFKNKYSEVLNVREGAVNVTSVAGIGTTLQQVTSATDSTLTDVTVALNEIVAGVKVSPNVNLTAGNYTLLITSGTASTAVNFPVVAKAQLNGMALAASSVDVIKNDTLDVATPVNTDNIVIDGGVTYKLVPVSFVDNYGNAAKVYKSAAGVRVGTDTTDLTLNVTGADKLSVKYFKGLNNTDEAANGEEIKYIAIAEDDLTVDASVEYVNFEIKDGTTVKASANLTVNVLAERALRSLAITPATATNMVVGSTKTYTISGLDQYGGVVNLDSSLIEMVADQNSSYVVTGVADNADANKINVTIRADKTGNFTPVFYYESVTNNQVRDTNELSVNAGTLTITELGDAVKTLTIQPRVGINLNGTDDDTTADMSKYKAMIKTNDATNAYTFSVKGYNATGEEVVLAGNSVFYTVVGNSLVSTADDGTASGVPSSALSFTGSALTVNTTGISDSISGTVTVRATSLNGVTAEFTMTLSSAARTAQTGTYFLSNDADGYDASGAEVAALTSIELKEDEGVGNPDLTSNGVRQVYLVARDQYGKLIDVNESSFMYGQDSSAYFTVTADGDSIDITAVTAGSSTLRIFKNGAPIINTTVTVNQDAVDAL